MPSMREGGRLVSQVHQLAGRVFARVLKRHGIDDLNPAQGRIVFALWQRDGLSQAALAAATKLDKSTLTLMLDRLQEAGHIRRVAAPGDARKRLVFLTERNRALHASYESASLEMCTVFYGGFSPMETECFERMLQRIVANLEATEGGRGGGRAE